MIFQYLDNFSFNFATLNIMYDSISGMVHIFNTTCIKNNIDLSVNYYLNLKFNLSTLSPMYETNSSFLDNLYSKNVIFNKAFTNYICNVKVICSTFDYKFIPTLACLNYNKLNCLHLLGFILKYKFVLLMIATYILSTYSASYSYTNAIIPCKNHSEVKGKDYKSLNTIGSINYMHIMLSNISYVLYIIMLFLLILILSFTSWTLINILLVLFLLVKLNINGLSKKLVFLYILFNLFPLSGSMITPELGNKLYIAICFVFNIMYIAFLSLYDYLNLRNKKGNPLFNNKYINHIFNGIVYLLAIELGIFASNCFYFLTNQYNYQGLWFIISALVTVLSSSFWNTLQPFIFDNNNNCGPDWQLCVLRCTFEALCFNSVAWNTYCSWDFIIGLGIEDINILSAIIGLILNILFSYNTIRLEHHSSNDNNSPLIYGMWYILSFTTLAFSTNGIVNIISSHIDGYPYFILLGILSGIATIVLHPDFYRMDQSFVFWLLLAHVLLYYFLFLNFVVVGWIIFLPLTF